MGSRKRLGLVVGLVSLLVASCGGGGSAAPAPPPPLESVCGGPVTSTPTTCLSVTPTVVPRGGSVVLTAGLSDLEGDVNEFCVGFALLGTEPVILCEAGEPRGTLINESITTDPIPLISDTGVPLPAGQYRFAIVWGDAAGHTSNVATADFSIVP